MRWPFVSRARYEALEADRERIRGERDQFLKDRNAAQAATEKAAALFTRADEALAAVSKTNARLTEELAEARAQADDSQVGRLRAELKREQRSVGEWQKKYYDAVGLGPGRIEDSRSWQPGYQAPKPDGVSS